MIEFTVNDPDKTLMNHFHQALKGSPGYINSEIAICNDKNSESFTLIIGNDNDNNLSGTIDFKENDGE